MLRMMRTITIFMINLKKIYRKMILKKKNKSKKFQIIFRV